MSISLLFALGVRFPTDKALFFSIGSRLDLKNCLSVLYKNDILRKELDLNAYDWAKNRLIKREHLEFQSVFQIFSSPMRSKET